MADQPIFPSAMKHEKQTAFRLLAYAGAIAVATAIAWVWTELSRRLYGHAPITWEVFKYFNFNPVGMAHSLQTLLIPLLLIYLFSHSSLFRRVVNKETKPGDQMRLVFALAAFQLVAITYNTWFTVAPIDNVSFGFLIVIVGGLLGGWRVGLGLGLFSMVIAGTNWYLWDTHGRIFSRVVAPGSASMSVVQFLWNDLVNYYLANLRAVMAIWAGVVAGLSGAMLGERRFSPPVAFGLGVIIQGVAAFFAGVVVERPSDYYGLASDAILVMGLALSIFSLVVHATQVDGARRKAVRAELARTRAELFALRAQINPHFLFNALNTIRYCVRTNPDQARSLLLDLSEIFQGALKAGEFTSLRSELSFADAYLSLEKARLGERLKVVWRGFLQPDAPLQTDSPWMEILVPTLILQPIVENAVVHGIAPKSEGGTVTITVTSADHALVMQVEDDGIGMTPERLQGLLQTASRTESVGIGLRNVDERLRILYGEGHRLELVSEVGRGTRVSLRISNR